MVDGTFEPERASSARANRITLIVTIVAFFLLWFVIPLLVPGFSRMMYMITLPFRHLGVFVHEMGHGLFTLLTMGSFHWFQMEFMQGGVAVTSGGWRMATLLGGLLGPSLLGAWLLQASTRQKGIKPELYGLMVLFLFGVYYITKPLFLSREANPMLAQWSVKFLFALLIPGAGLALTFFALRCSLSLQRIYLQILGVLMCYSGYSDTRYIFMYDQLPNGLFSDARIVASLVSWYAPENVPRLLFLVVAVLISVLNFGLMFWGVRRALRVGKRAQPAVDEGLA